jgi:fumarylacetoacetase
VSDPYWIEEAAGTPYGLAALPYGILPPGRVGVRIGERALDLAPLVPDRWEHLVVAGDLNPLMAAGPAVWRELRQRVIEWLTEPVHRATVERNLHPVGSIAPALPFRPADYVDFYASSHHAENLGAFFRPGQPPLPRNWLHLPIGYHGRSGTLVVSGTEIVRPWGQTRPAGAERPVYGPSSRLDIEAEVGFVVGVPSPLGRPVAGAEFADHVFGVVLVNDWSARDLQSWEYVPLGPFLGKSFATSVSSWLLPLEALEHARIEPPARREPLLPYLRDGAPWGLDIDLTVELNGVTVARPPFSAMYWTAAQMLAHMTVNGASLRTGDLFASGTVSGPEPGQRGSLIELSWNGERPIVLPGGERRSFLQDGDEVVIAGTAPGRDGTRVGLGEVRGTIRSAEREP